MQHKYRLTTAHVFRGGGERTSFELVLANLAEWFIDHPPELMHHTLTVANDTQYNAGYRY